jgi:hypothetical protein
MIKYLNIMVQLNVIFFYSSLCHLLLLYNSIKINHHNSIMPSFYIDVYSINQLLFLRSSFSYFVMHIDNHAIFIHVPQINYQID